MCEEQECRVYLQCFNSVKWTYPDVRYPTILSRLEIISPGTWSVHTDCSYPPEHKFLSQGSHRLLLKGRLWKQFSLFSTHQRSQSSWHRSWPGTVPSVPPWELDSSWCSWCRSGPWGPGRQKVRWEVTFNDLLEDRISEEDLLRHLTIWIWIISRCAEVTVDGITT